LRHRPAPFAVGPGRTYLIPILADFLKAYPDIEVSLILNDRVQSLFQEQIDVGLRIGALPDSSDSPRAARDPPPARRAIWIVELWVLGDVDSVKQQLNARSGADFSSG
jgi:DNA-binding transcriptional LysR family regulator